jgi:hypothetical protein
VFPHSLPGWGLKWSMKFDVHTHPNRRVRFLWVISDSVDGKCYSFTDFPHGILHRCAGRESINSHITDIVLAHGETIEVDERQAQSCGPSFSISIDTTFLYRPGSAKLSFICHLILESSSPEQSPLITR